MAADVTGRRRCKTFAQLRRAHDAAYASFGAALAVQGEAEAALYAFRALHGPDYEKADGYRRRNGAKSGRGGRALLVGAPGLWSLRTPPDGKLTFAIDR